MIILQHELISYTRVYPRFKEVERPIRCDAVRLSEGKTSVSSPLNGTGRQPEQFGMCGQRT